MVAEENDLKEQNYKVMGKWSKLAHVCWEGGNVPLKEFPGKWIRLCCDLAGCTVTTQLFTMWLSVAQTIHGRLYSDHTTIHSVAECGTDKLIHGRLYSDHTTIHSVAECGTDKLIHGRLYSDHTTIHNMAECGTDHVDTRKAAQ